MADIDSRLGHSNEERFAPGLILMGNQGPIKRDWLVGADSLESIHQRALAEFGLLDVSSGVGKYWIRVLLAN